MTFFLSLKVIENKMNGITLALAAVLVFAPGCGGGATIRRIWVASTTGLHPRHNDIFNLLTNRTKMVNVELKLCKTENFIK